MIQSKPAHVLRFAVTDAVVALIQYAKQNGINVATNPETSNINLNAQEGVVTVTLVYASSSSGDNPLN